MLLWSSGPGARDYTRGTHEFGSVSLPDGMSSRLTDTDNNSIPDSIENMSLADRQNEFSRVNPQSSTNTSLLQSSIVSGQLTLGFSDRSTTQITQTTQALVDGLSC
jgi:hypothetical protein